MYSTSKQCFRLLVGCTYVLSPSPTQLEPFSFCNTFYAPSRTHFASPSWGCSHRIAAYQQLYQQVFNIVQISWKFSVSILILNHLSTAKFRHKLKITRVFVLSLCSPVSFRDCILTDFKFCKYNNIYLLQLGCDPVAVVILHVYKTWNWLLLNLSWEGYMRSM
jgi:hypothetical protein